VAERPARRSLWTIMMSEKIMDNPSNCPLCGSPLVCWPLSDNGMTGIFVGVEVMCKSLNCDWRRVLRPYHIAEAAVVAYRVARRCNWTQAPSDDERAE